MKHKYLILSLMFILSFPALHAQTPQPTYIFPTELGDSVIVREYKEEMTVIYAQPSRNQGRFYLVDGSNTVNYFDLPDNIEVRDFEIKGDTAYFCGLNSYGAVLGGFDILGAFSAVMHVNYAILSNWIISGSNSIFIEELQRIDLFRYGTNVVMAMVGKSRLFDYEPVQLQRTTIVGAMLIPSMYGICASIEKEGLTMFTDVACLEDMVLAVGHDTYGHGQYAKVYDKTMGYGFPSTTIFQHNKITMPLATHGRVLTTCTGANNAACLQLCDNGTTVLSDLVFSTTSLAISNYPTLYPYPFSLSNTLYWTLGEIRYNIHDNIVYAVERGSLPGSGTIEPIVLHYPYGVGGNNPITYDLAGWQPSLDVNYDGRITIAGEYSGKLDMYYRKVMPMEEEAGCSENATFLYNLMNIDVSPAQADDMSVNDTRSTTQYLPIVFKTYMNIMCE